MPDLMIWKQISLSHDKNVVCTGIYKFGNNTYPCHIRRRFEFRSHFSGKKVRLMGQEIRYFKMSHKYHKDTKKMGKVLQVFVVS